jgi:hypothetical protein
MCWNTVRETLISAVALTRDSSAGTAWVDQLPSAADGDLLGVCLAIDLISGATKPETVAQIVDDVRDEDGDARSKFYQAVNRCVPSVRCQSRLTLSTPDAVSYMRIIELGDFILYYLRPVYPYTTDPADVATVRRLFLRRTPRPLGDITNPWSGRHQIVWVIPEQEVQAALTRSVTGNDAAVELADRLGLALNGGVGPGNALELIAVTYPTSFESDHGIQCHQPTTFDANWSAPGTLYVSHGRNDGWGRTRSCSGTRQQMPERVHSELPRLTDGFSLTPIGVAPPPSTDRSAILDEACHRLDTAAGI